MRVAVAIMVVALLVGSEAIAADKWYAGDEHCPPPKNDGTYSAPYNALEHPTEYPVFADATKHGWYCSYQDKKGIIIQYGDGRTPQEQWIAVWGDTRP